MTIVSPITRWIGYLVRLSCACRSLWSAAVWLPRQPCSRSGTCHDVDPAGHGDDVCTRLIMCLSEMNEIPSSRCF